MINNVYALEFTPWNEWLGTHIANAVFEQFTTPEKSGHFLFEMTSISFDNEAIKKEKANLETQIDAIENMTEEERQNVFISREGLEKSFFDRKKMIRCAGRRLLQCSTY